MEFRKTNKRALHGYANESILRVTQGGVFTVSKLIVESLKLDGLKFNIDIHALMFKKNNGELEVYLELKMIDNYHLSNADNNVYRFKSKDLKAFLDDHFNFSKEQTYFLKLENSIFKLNK